MASRIQGITVEIGVQAEDIEIKREIDEMLERIDRKIVNGRT